jgi:heptosyltransferase-3
VKVLVIQVRQLGDVLLSTPICRALKENLPKVEVHFLTSRIGKEIVSGNPWIDKVIVLEEGFISELKTIFSVLKNKYDAVIDAQRTGRSRRITFLSFSPVRIAFKKKSREFGYNKLIKWEDRGYTAWERLKLLEGLGLNIKDFEKYLPEFYNFEPIKSVKLDKNYVVIVPTARKREKMWEQENFVKLISFFLKETNLTPVVLYGPGEEKLVEAYRRISDVIVPAKPLSIGEAASVIKGALLFVGLNSFASHLSVAVGTKTVVIDKKKSGWFPPLLYVREVYGKAVFPEVKDVERAVLELIGG